MDMIKVRTLDYLKSERSLEPYCHVVCHLGLHTSDILSNDRSLSHLRRSLILKRFSACIVVRQRHVETEKNEVGDGEAIAREKGRVRSSLSKLGSHLLVEFRKVINSSSVFFFSLFEVPVSRCFRGPEIERGLQGPIDKEALFAIVF